MDGRFSLFWPLRRVFDQKRVTCDYITPPLFFLSRSFSTLKWRCWLRKLPEMKHSIPSGMKRTIPFQPKSKGSFYSGLNEMAHFGQNGPYHSGRNGPYHSNLNGPYQSTIHTRLALGPPQGLGRQLVTILSLRAIKLSNRVSIRNLKHSRWVLGG